MNVTDALSGSLPVETSSYGSQFLLHLQQLSKSSCYNYRELQQIKAMNQQELAEKLKAKYQSFADIILDADPGIAAEQVHKLAAEMALGSSRSAATMGTTEFIGTLIQLMAIPG